MKNQVNKSKIIPRTTFPINSTTNYNVSFYIKLKNGERNGSNFHGGFVVALDVSIANFLALELETGRLKQQLDLSLSCTN